MAETLTIRTASSTEVIKVAVQGPQGPAGPAGPPGEVSGSIAWDNITSKPSTFAPSAHTHTASEITDFTAAVEAVSPPADWDTLANKPASFAPSAHKASHATGGTDALAPSDIGAQSIFEQLSLTSDTGANPYQLAASRAVFIRVFTTADYAIRLPASGHSVGDIVEVRAETLAATKSITVERDISGSGVWIPAATLSVEGQKRRFRATSTSSNGWQEDSYFTTDGTIGAAASHTHADATTTVAGFLSASDKSKIDGIASNATANSSDATLLNRANHTGTQAANTITGLAAIATSGSASDLTSGTVATARLGTGTANSTSFLRGDGQWAAPSGGGATNLWIPASAFIPKTTAGCGVDSRETTTNDQNFDELLFDAGSDEFADALVVMPSNYNNGTITARFYWTAASGSGGVAFAIQGRAFANDDALDTAAGTAQLVTDTLIAANDMHVTSATSAVTIGGTPAANTPIQFTIYRDVSDAADNLAVDARLLGVEIIYTAA